MINVFRNIDGIETTVTALSLRQASHHSTIMNADELTINTVVSSPLTIEDGDYIYYNGLKYTTNRTPEYTKNSDVEYQYSFVFEHPFYRLLDKLFTYKLTGSPVFSLTGKLADFVDLIVWNMNYHSADNPLGVDSGWSNGVIIDTDYLNLSFSSISCRDALTQVATAFNAEFFFSENGKTINFVDHIENETGLVFSQGLGNGLYSITQQNVDTKDTITRVYPVGGNKNVPNANADADGYLKLPEIYLQNNTDFKRVVEKRVVFEDIYPHFVGNIESVSGTDNISFICSAIDFDLNAIAVGSNARINFLTGSLMGIAFQFSFDYTTKKVTLIAQNDDTALDNNDGTKPQVPRALKKAVVGDKFNFTGVVMPSSYVTTAINKLRTKATSWLDFYSRKRVKFTLEIDHRWMRGKQELATGDLITVEIPEKSISKTIRITEITKDLYDGKLSATVSNYLDENWEKKVEGAISSLQTTVSGGTYGAGVDILQRYDERPLSDRNVMSSLRSEKNFLRKDAVDTAAEYIHFKKGMDALDFVQDKFAGSGAGIYKDEQGNSVMEVDKLSVRKEAWFNEIIINQIRFQGGIVVYSAATMEVLSIVDGGSYIQASFDTKNGQVSNQFAVDDQIRCQRFSGGSVIKYYMSRVTSVGTDYIRLSKSDIDGTLNVQVGDQLVQFGNRTNTARQSLIEVNVLDGGKQTFYQGVNSYSLTNKNYLELGRVLVDGTWRNMIRSFGGAYLGNRDLSSYIQYNETSGEVEIKANVQFKSTSGTYKSIASIDDGLADITSDNKLTPNEKQQLKREWDSIYNEYTIISQRGQDIYGNSDDYDDAYWYLNEYISPLLADLTTTSTITDSELRARFNLYYLRREQIINNIQRTIDAQSKAADYLQLALTGSTDISGGLVGTNVILLKTLAGVISGGMSGLASDPVGFWTGGTYAQAVADAAKAFKSAMDSGALDKKDGSGHRAKGNLAWDTAGDVFVRGLLEVLSGGKIGNFDIIAGRVAGKDSNGIERVSLGVDSIPVSPSLLASQYIVAYDYSSHDDITGVLSNSSESQQSTGFTNYVEHTFQITTATYIQFATGFGFDEFDSPGSVVSSNVTVDAQIYLNGVLKGVASEQTPFWVNGAGTVTVKERLNITAILQPNSSTGYKFIVAGYGWGKYQESTSKSAIGKNGLFSFWNTGKYFYFSEEFGGEARGHWDIPAGLGGASINGSGGVSAWWGKIDSAGKVAKSGSNYTITHNIGDTNYSIILTPISTNVAYFSSKNANTIVVTCSSGFDFVLIRTV